MPGIHSAGAKLSDTTTRHLQEMPPVCDGEMAKHSPSSRKAEVWRENYVGGEEMAVGRGTGINIISYLINIAFFAANLMEAK